VIGRIFEPFEQVQQIAAHRPSDPQPHFAVTLRQARGSGFEMAKQKTTSRAKTKPKSKAQGKKAVARKTVSRKKPPTKQRAPKARATATKAARTSSVWPGLPPGYFDRGR
jgi:hypothetical protein